MEKKLHRKMVQLEKVGKMIRVKQLLPLFVCFALVLTFMPAVSMIHTTSQSADANFEGSNLLSDLNGGVTLTVGMGVTEAGLAAAAIPQVSAGASHTVGLKSDGTVVAVGDNEAGQCDVSGWSGIQQVSALSLIHI